MLVLLKVHVLARLVAEGWVIDRLTLDWARSSFFRFGHSEFFLT